MRTLSGRRARWAALVTAVSLVVSACAASTVDGTGSLGDAADSNLTVVGDAHNEFDQTVKNALSDVTEFWTQEYPKVSGGKALPPIKGGIYSVDGEQVVQTGKVSGDAAKEGCIAAKAEFIIDNAAYCRLDDSIVWDRNDKHLVPQLAKHYGPLLVGLVFAHEFGHAISERLGIFAKNPPTIDTESQADCAAGAWAAAMLKNQAPHFRNMKDKLDDALEGFLDVRDSTPEQGQELSHGNGFDRLAAIADGIQNGVTYCYSSTYFNRKFTERPFTTDQDLQSGGNETLQQVLDPSPPKQDGTGGGGLQPDLNRFWTSAAKSINKNFKDVTIAEAAHPKCGSVSPKSEFGYCPDDNTVYYSNSFAKQAYNSLPDISIDPHTADVTLLFNQPADFTLGTLFTVAWGLAVRHQLFNRGIEDGAALLAASCYSGAYAKNINVDQSTSTTSFVLSPPDLDEATSAMLTLVNLDQAYSARGTTGLQRIQSFVKGYNGGLSVC
jgi:predicted metalloprotease